MQGRKSLYFAGSSVLAATVLSIFLHSSLSSPNLYSDIGSFWGRDWIRAGLFPNLSQNTFFEYPPLASYFLYFARAVGGSYDGYYAVFSVLSLCTAVGIGWSSWRLAKALGRELNPVYFILPSMVVYGLYSFDLFNAFLIVLSLQFFVEGKKTASGIALALAVSTKLVGILLLPIFLMGMNGSRRRRRYLLVVAIVVLLTYAPFLILNFGYFSQFLSFFRTWGLEDAWYVWIFQNPATWGYAKAFGLGLTCLLLFFVYTRRLEVTTKSFLALSAYLVGTYLYAPQFSLMLIPLVAVLDLRNP
ncbi:MAG: glycosyltransferase 87 family protein, partial [Candidatus Gagatemarchaeaceae archaeon]